MPIKLEDVSRAVSHALRHEPDKYGLTLAPEGWVEIDDLLAGLQKRGSAWAQVNRTVLDEMIAAAKKQRYEIDGARIRAFYGHSVDGKIERPNIEPPAVLFHGTSPEAWAIINVEGLRPMNRQSVHMSADRETAVLVGRRKSREPVILEVDAKSASRAGISFALGNENVWLADGIAPEFIHLAD